MTPRWGCPRGSGAALERGRLAVSGDQEVGVGVDGLAGDDWRELDFVAADAALRKDGAAGDGYGVRHPVLVVVYAVHASAVDRHARAEPTRVRLVWERRVGHLRLLSWEYSP